MGCWCTGEDCCLKYHRLSLQKQHHVPFGKANRFWLCHRNRWIVRMLKSYLGCLKLFLVCGKKNWVNTCFGCFLGQKWIVGCFLVQSVCMVLSKFFGATKRRVGWEALVVELHGVKATFLRRKKLRRTWQKPLMFGEFLSLRTWELIKRIIEVES